jgi:uncharacterized membrane protein YqjE
VTDLGGSVLVRLRRIGRTLLSLIHVRLELIAAETETFVEGVLNEWALRLLGLLLLVLALAFAGIAVLLAVSENHRLAAALALAFLFALGTGLCAFSIRRSRQRRGRWLALTAEELRRDLASAKEEDV